MWRVGDRVKFVASPHPLYGKVGTIKRLRRLRGLRATVQFDNYKGGATEFLVEGNLRNVTKRW